MPRDGRSFTPTRAQRLAVGLVALAVSLAIGLVLGEALVRMFAPHAVRTPMFDRVNGLLANSPDTRARAYTPGAFDVTYTTGPQRFRGSKSYDPQPAPGVLRIATIGDSFTFGDGANDDESYPFDLERLLRADGHNVEVLNAGVGNAGTGTEALYFDEYVRQFHPNIVILGVVGNDPSDDAITPLFRKRPDGTLAPVPASERFHSRLWRLSRAIHRFPPVSWLYGHSELLSMAEYELRNLREPALRYVNSSDATYTEQQYQLTEDEIAWLAERVKAAGAKLVVVYLPSSVSTYQTTGEPYETWRREEGELANACAIAAMNTHASFLDLRPYMRGVYERSHQTLYHHGLDEHPNAAGYRAFAQGIADFLRRSGVVASP